MASAGVQLISEPSRCNQTKPPHTFDGQDRLPFACFGLDALEESKDELSLFSSNVLFGILSGQNAPVGCQTFLAPLDAAALAIEKLLDAVGKICSPGIREGIGGIAIQ